MAITKCRNTINQLLNDIKKTNIQASYTSLFYTLLYGSYPVAFRDDMSHEEINTDDNSEKEIQEEKVKISKPGRNARYINARHIDEKVDSIKRAPTSVMSKEYTRTKDTYLLQNQPKIRTKKQRKTKIFKYNPLNKKLSTDVKKQLETRLSEMSEPIAKINSKISSIGKVANKAYKEDLAATLRNTQGFAYTIR